MKRIALFLTLWWSAVLALAQIPPAPNPPRLVNDFANLMTKEQVADVYESVRSEIPEYNMWDFFVTLQMVKSDNCPMLKKWFPNATPEEMTQKFVAMAVNWLKDEDNPFGTEKIWKYLNSK